ncbi:MULTISPECIES: hypothetical protein [unclassified Nocardioides]|uniref:hypothetical protein n=1 Tax=unclassified Nocardioides TaxID=2615069 RepID=UPI000AD451E2|nr:MULTISPECIES: hypothetical protein [unclassified Nocardioides]
MRTSRILVTTAAMGAALLLSTGPATAGEVTGNGGATQGPAHANSICTFSGLADGGEGEPAGPGNVQNWGHSREAFGATPAERKASGFQPGDSCNGHSGFLVSEPSGTP